MTPLSVQVKCLTDTARLPQFAHPHDACADLYADEQKILHPHEIGLISTGIAIQLPKHYEAQIRPRSGLALKHGLMIVNSPGTIDAGYRGEIKVIMLNSKNTDFEITAGMRLAQIAVRPVPEVEFVRAEELSSTSRSTGGFGSTGTK